MMLGREVEQCLPQESRHCPLNHRAKLPAAPKYVSPQSLRRGKAVNQFNPRWPTKHSKLTKHRWCRTREMARTAMSSLAWLKLKQGYGWAPTIQRTRSNTKRSTRKRKTRSSSASQREREEKRVQKLGQVRPVRQQLWERITTHRAAMISSAMSRSPIVSVQANIASAARTRRADQNLRSHGSRRRQLVRSNLTLGSNPQEKWKGSRPKDTGLPSTKIKTSATSKKKTQATSIAVTHPP